MNPESDPKITESKNTASRPRQWTWGRLIGVWTIIIATILIGAESAVRLFCFPFLPFEKMTRIHALVGIPALNEMLVNDKVLFWRNKPNLHDFHVSGKVFQWPIDFHVTTDARGLRVTPDPPCPESEAFRILTIGDSCTFGFGVNDNESWPAQLQQSLESNASGRHYKVLNAGVPAYTAYQCLQYLRTQGLTLKPNLVILQTWINDVNTWGWGDYKMAGLMDPPAWQQVLLKSSFYQFIGRVVMEIRTPERPRLLPDEFTGALTDIVQTCNEAGIPIAFLVWPDQNSFRQGKLAPYPAAFEQFAQDRSIPCVNVLPAIYGKPGPYYVDVCHATKAGNAATASLLAPEVLALTRPH